MFYPMVRGLEACSGDLGSCDMTEEQRQEIIRLLQHGDEISPEWARILFPPEKREYELVYHGKEREEDILANTLAVPLQPVRTFAKNGIEWHNQLIFGDNLQVMKSLRDLKRAGRLCNADGTPGVRLGARARGRTGADKDAAGFWGGVAGPGVQREPDGPVAGSPASVGKVLCARPKT
jgi:hypothetical protein